MANSLRRQTMTSLVTSLGQSRRRLLMAAVLVIAIVSSVQTSNAQPAPFYKDKTIRIIVGFTSGGLYDQYARLLARHMGKYIPGNPTIIVQNMPGAGSLSATNYIYGVAKHD